MYEAPICRVCNYPLAIVEEHTHQYLRQITNIGKVGRVDKVNFRHKVNEVMRCIKCRRLYALKWDDERRVLRGRQVGTE